MTKMPWSLLTEGSASLHSTCESAGSRYSKRFKESWAGGSSFGGWDAGSFATAIGTRRRYQKIDIVVFSTFGWIHNLYYNLWAIQLRNSYYVLPFTCFSQIATSPPIIMMATPSQTTLISGLW